MPGITRLPSLLALLALLAILAVLPGCGSDEISGEIPLNNANQLNAALDGVSNAIASQNCEAATAQAEEFVNAVNALPADPAADLKPELQAAGNNLRTLVSDECTTTEPTQQTSTQQPETSSTTSTTSSSTEETDTTTTSTTTSTDETEPPGNGQGQGPSGGGPPGQGTDGGTGDTGGTGSGSGD